MSLDWVHVSHGATVCTTEELRDIADEPGLFDDGAIGVLFDNGDRDGDRDGAALYATGPDELIAVLETAVKDLRALKAQQP